MNITIFGIGYVGLVYAAVLAEVGHHVLCIDIDEEKIKRLKKNILPIFEPGLEILVQSNYHSGHLNFSTNIEEGVNHAVLQMITVGTPSNQYGDPNLTYVISAISTIAKYMHEYKIIINKSTVPVGTNAFLNQHMITILNKRKKYYSFHIVANPEFLRQGSAVKDCMYPDRIIIGTDNVEEITLVYQLYEYFNKSKDRIILMDIRSAEFTKYAANCMLATKISFINEMANISESFGADIEKVRRGIGADSRIGYDFINPGCGYGGSCFSKDIQALIHMSKLINYTPHLLHAIEHVNRFQKSKLVTLIKNHFDNNLKNKIFALWGLSFKPNTNDMRNASSCILMEKLWQAGANIHAFDPAAMNEAYRIYGNHNQLKLMSTKESVLKNADALIICTEWKHFHEADFNLIKKMLKQPVIFDGRNIYDPHYVSQYGIIYYAIGRGASITSSPHIYDTQRNYI